MPAIGIFGRVTESGYAFFEVKNASKKPLRAFSLGGIFTRLRQAKTRRNNYSFLTTNLLTAKALGPMGCGRCGQEPPRVVVGNVSVAS
jgi:hypothetical protein